LSKTSDRFFLTLFLDGVLTTEQSKTLAWTSSLTVIERALLTVCQMGF
jgi:hypothetical protein